MRPTRYDCWAQQGALRALYYSCETNNQCEQYKEVLLEAHRQANITADILRAYNMVRRRAH